MHREQPQGTDTRARAQQSKKKDDQDHRQMPRPEEPGQTVDHGALEVIHRPSVEPRGKSHALNL
jgi:hypothetical protein